MLNVTNEITRLGTLSMTLLKDEYREVWGEPARSNNRAFLVKRIVWRRQAIEQGDLSQRARTRALEIGRDEDVRVRPGPLQAAAFKVNPVPRPVATTAPMPGTVIRRVYRGREYVVEVLEKGFRIEGITHASLSAAAKAITGSTWNGPLFFGLTKRGGKS